MNSSKLPITVVVPVYNRSELIVETLESILAQTRAPEEIIVVDDGSSDGTGEVVQGFPPPVRCVVIRNSGVCRARNVGVAASRTPWIAFCDSDDLWRPDKLERQWELVEAAPAVPFHFCNFVHVVDGRWEERADKFSLADEAYWSAGRQVIGPNQWVFNESLYSRTLRFQPIFQSNILMSREYFDRIGGYNEALGRVLSEDLEFTLRCVAMAPVAVHAQPLVGIRKHAANFSGDQARVLLGEIEILRYAMAHHAAAATCLAVLQDEVERRSLEAADALFAAGDLAATREAFRAVPFQRRSPKQWIKTVISHLPAGLAGALRARLVK